MRLALILIALAVPGLATAGPDRISVLLGSHHASPGQDFEEINPGVFLTWEGEFDTTVGVYRNSYGRASVAATAGYTFYEADPFSLSVFAGAAYYPDDGSRFRVHVGDFVPLAGLQARVGPTFFQILPSDGEEADVVFTFGLTVPLQGR